MIRPSRSLPASLIFFGVFASFASGCGQEAYQSNMDREIDRGRENARVLQSEYQAIEGQYEIEPSETKNQALRRLRAKGGLTALSTTEAKSRMRAATDSAMEFWIELDIESIPVQQAGSVVPEPSLTGTFRFWNVDARGKADRSSTPIVFNFSNGVFDRGSGQLAVKVAGINTDGIQVSCHAKDAESSLISCIWIPASGRAERRVFTLRRNGDTR